MSNNSITVWACPLTKTGKKSKAKDAHAKCAKQFADENRFELIHTADNGDCFFNTLTRFAFLANYRPLLRSNENPNYDAKYDMEGHPNDIILREDLVNHMEDHLQDYIYFINNNEKSVENQLALLREGGIWDTSIGDLVVPVGANAFGININLYNIEENNEGKDVIKLKRYPSKYHPSGVDVDILRINEGHFELLLPTNGNKSRNDEFDEKSSSIQIQQSLYNKQNKLNQSIIQNLQSLKFNTKKSKTKKNLNQSILQQLQSMSFNTKKANSNSVSTSKSKSKSKSTNKSTSKNVNNTKKQNQSNILNKLQSNILSYMNSTKKTAKQKEAERARIVAKIVNSNISENVKNQMIGMMYH
jgi:hypothetical protein